MKYSTIIAAASLTQPAQAKVQRRLDNGLSLTPHMGWSSWNVAQCEAASERYALDTANRFIELGLADLGYEYVNIDDCWSTKDLDGEGKLVPDPSKWPRGIRAVADEIHAMGLKLGLYGCVGSRTCADFPGSEGHEAAHVAQLVEWDVDFWKVDNCYTPCLDQPDPQTCARPAGHTRDFYTPMRDAIVAAHDAKPILFNLCQWGRDSVWEWGADYGNSWRMSTDNWQDWESVVRIGSAAASIWEHSGPGGWNDLDMLVVGNGVLSEPQERLHFGLWAIAKSPLVLGNDLTTVSDSTLAIIKNAGIIAVNQDELGVAATTFVPPGQPDPVNGQVYPFWAGPLSDGVVIGLTGANGGGVLSVNFSDVPGLEAGTYEWEEYYTGETGSGDSVSFDVPADDMRVIKVFA